MGDSKWNPQSIKNGFDPKMNQLGKCTFQC